MKLSRTQIEYLLIMDEMMEEGPVRLRDVAQALGVSKPSVHGMEEQFVRLGLIEKQRYAPVHMTEEGLRTAEEYRLQVQALSRCLEKALGLPGKRGQGQRPGPAGGVVGGISGQGVFLFVRPAGVRREE